MAYTSPWNFGNSSGFMGGLSTSPIPTPGYSVSNPFLTNTAQTGFSNAQQPFNSQWYDNLGQSLWNQASKNYNENIAPAIQGSANLAGQYGGGNRAEIAKGMALQGLNQNVMNALAPQYAQGYENSQNRSLQAGQSAMSGLLGLGQLDIGSYNAQNQAAQAAAAANGTQMFTNPWASAIGAGLGTAQIGSLLGWW